MIQSWQTWQGHCINELTVTLIVYTRSAWNQASQHFIMELAGLLKGQSLQCSDSWSITKLQCRTTHVTVGSTNWTQVRKRMYNYGRKTCWGTVGGIGWKVSDEYNKSPLYICMKSQRIIRINLLKNTHMGSCLHWN